MRRPPTEISGESKFLYRNFVEKHFRGRGPRKSMFLRLFSKIDTGNFAQFGKTCFFCYWFFWKVEELGRYFGGCATNLFLQKLSNIARFRFKNERYWRRTHGVIRPYFTVFILAQHSRFCFNKKIFLWELWFYSLEPRGVSRKITPLLLWLIRMVKRK